MKEEECERGGIHVEREEEREREGMHREGHRSRKKVRERECT